MQWWLSPMASLLYLVSAWMFWRVEKKAHNPLWALGVMVFACQAHALTLIMAIGRGSGLNLSVFNVISIFAWSIACLSVIWLWRSSLALGGVIVTLINALLVMLPCIFISEKPFLNHLDSGMIWHILTAVAAWTVLSIAALHAILYGIFFQRLKQKLLKKGNFMSLAGIERVMMILTAIGFVLLGISLATGWLYVEDLFAQHLWHKTILTMFSWLIYSWLLFAYFIGHKRGVFVVYISLLAYVLLIVGYIVSNIVLQFIVSS